MNQQTLGVPLVSSFPSPTGFCRSSQQSLPSPQSSSPSFATNCSRDILAGQEAYNSSSSTTTSSSGFNSEERQIFHSDTAVSCPNLINPLESNPRQNQNWQNQLQINTKQLSRLNSTDQSQLNYFSLPSKKTVVEKRRPSLPNFNFNNNFRKFSSSSSKSRQQSISPNSLSNKSILEREEQEDEGKKRLGDSLKKKFSLFSLDRKSVV